MLPPRSWSPLEPVWPVRHGHRLFRAGWAVHPVVDEHGHRLQVVLAANVSAFVPEAEVLRAATIALERHMVQKRPLQAHPFHADIV